MEVKNTSHGVILIVDDAPGNLGVLTNYLKTFGYKTPVARNGEIAIKRAKHICPDLILLDVLMPGIDGFEICRRLKADEATRDIPVIFVSAASDRVAKMKGFEVGGVDYITKPFQMEEILARVETHLKLRRRVAELATLNRITQTLTAVTDLRTALNMVARHMVELFHARNSGIALLNAARSELTVVASYSRSQAEPEAVGIVIPLQNNPSSIQVVEQRRAVIVSHAQTNPLTKEIHAIMRARRIQCLMIIPLLARGEVIGTIGIDSIETDREFTPAELALAETVAGQVAGAIENARLFEEERRQRQVAESLQEVALALNSRLDLQTVLVKILEQLERVIKYDGGAIFLQEGESLVLSDGVNLNEKKIGRRIPLTSTAPTAQVFQRKQACMIADTETYPDWEIWPDGSPIKSWMGAPLLVEGKTLGVLTADSFEVGAYCAEDVGVLQTFANQAAIAIKNARQVARTEAALQETQLLYRVSRILAHAADMQHGIEQVLGEYLQALHLQQGAVSLFDLDQQCGRLYAFYRDGQPQPPGVVIKNISAGHRQIIATGQPLAVFDALNDPLLAENREIAIAHHIKSILLVPLIVRGQVIGLLGADATEQPRHFSTREISLAQAIADQVATAIEHARLFDQEQQQRQAAEQARQEAEAANRAKTEFLAHMSHELRTPLNSILGFSQLMLRHKHLPPEQHDYLRIISRSGEHLLTLINNVLDLSKIEAGQMALNLQGCDLYQLLEEVVAMFRLRAKEKGLQLLLDHPLQVPQYIQTDVVKLRQVLINLLNNAVKFTEKGQVCLRVSALPALKNAETHQTLRFEVEDTGPGIHQHEISRLFEPFAQTATGRRGQEGTGLGLSISRRFVQLLSGELTVRSDSPPASPRARRKAEGPGTTVAFEIDVRVIAAAAFPQAQPARRPIGLAPAQPCYRMLIVDDKWDNHYLLVSFLSKLGPPPLGFDLREAENGQEAVELWAQWRPHVIWMDLQMPGLNGYEATQKIRQLETGTSPFEWFDSPSTSSEQAAHHGHHPRGGAGRTIIIAVTASAFEEERAVVLAAGCDDFLRKPFQEAELFDLLQKHLGVRYVYEEPFDNAVPQEREPPDRIRAAFVALPRALQDDLQRAAELLDWDLTNKTLERIRQCDPRLAEALLGIARQYRFDTLQELCNHLEKTCAPAPDS